jgi:hypothetical protein
MTPTMTLLPPMNGMIELNLRIFLSLWEAYRAFFFFFSMLPQTSYVGGTSLTTSLRYQDWRVIFKISLDRLVIWRAVKT